jgi:hypothetical protein
MKRDILFGATGGEGGYGVVIWRLGEAGGDWESFLCNCEEAMMPPVSGVPGVDVCEVKGSGGACVGVEGLEAGSESEKSDRSVEVERPECERVVFARSRTARGGGWISVVTPRTDWELGSGCEGVTKEGREDAREN